MDSRNMQNDNNHHLGVNKLGKNIRKSPLHQPNFPNGTTTTTTTTTTARQQPQPQVYNINKNDFRNIVQQLTGSPSRDPLPPHNPPKPSSMRLQRIRPPPLASLNRPQMPIHHHHPPPAQNRPLPAPMPYGNGLARPPPPTQFGQPSPTFFPSNGTQFGQPSPSFFPTNGAQFGQPSPSFLPRNAAHFPQPSPAYMHPNTAESPISAYMRYLQTSVIDSGPKQNPGQAQPQGQPPVSGQAQPQGLHPSIQGPPLASPRMGGLPPLLPSPTSQFLLPSPTGFMNLLSPRSPYPLLSPGYQFPPPLTPDFAFTPMGQPGILGPGPQPPVSPGIAFPPSPGFFPLSSPRWKDQWS